MVQGCGVCVFLCVCGEEGGVRILISTAAACSHEKTENHEDYFLIEG